MKKKNGFTLVELLAVIVVLAIIMIIAIPSVLDVMNSARKQTFVEYVEKVVNITQTKYTADSGLGGPIQHTGVYVYDITQDLGLNGTGNFKGYVVVNALNIEDIHYVITLYDASYELINYDVTVNKFPDVNTASIIPYNSADIANNANDPVQACHNASTESTPCYNKDGFLIQVG